MHVVYGRAFLYCIVLQYFTCYHIVSIVMCLSITSCFAVCIVSVGFGIWHSCRLHFFAHNFSVECRSHFVCILILDKMSASIQQPSSSEAIASDYSSPIKIFGYAKTEIGDIFSEMSGYISDSTALLNGLF